MRLTIGYLDGSAGTTVVQVQWDSGDSSIDNLIHTFHRFKKGTEWFLKKWPLAVGYLPFFFKFVCLFV
jgi:hypothetical protein